jgi:hypothetical protein
VSKHVGSPEFLIETIAGLGDIAYAPDIAAQVIYAALPSCPHEAGKRCWSCKHRFHGEILCGIDGCQCANVPDWPEREPTT